MADFTEADRTLLRELHGVAERTYPQLFDDFRADRATRRPPNLMDDAANANRPLPQRPINKLPFSNSAEAYWSMQLPEVQALRRIADPNARLAEAYRLARAGVVIDYALHVQLRDPLGTMRARREAKWDWWPNLLMPKPTPPDSEPFPGQPQYTPDPPPGAIITDTAFGDGYPY